jgi:hypothetical protein
MGWRVENEINLLVDHAEFIGQMRNCRSLHFATPDFLRKRKRQVVGPLQRG